MIRQRPLAVLAAAALALAGCQTGGDPAPGRTSAPPPAESAPATAASSPAATPAATGAAARPHATALRRLPDGTYLGRFSGLDNQRRRGRLIVECPLARTGDIYQVDLTDAKFGIESDPTHPENGSVVTVTFQKWLALADTADWLVVARGDAVLVVSFSAPTDSTPCDSAALTAGG